MVKRGCYITLIDSDERRVRYRGGRLPPGEKVERCRLPRISNQPECLRIETGRIDYRQPRSPRKYGTGALPDRLRASPDAPTDRDAPWGLVGADGKRSSGNLLSGGDGRHERLVVLLVKNALRGIGEFGAAQHRRLRRKQQALVHLVSKGRGEHLPRALPECLCD